MVVLSNHELALDSESIRNYNEILKAVVKLIAVRIYPKKT